MPVSPVKAEDVSEVHIDNLLKHLDNPEAFVAAHVILTRLYYSSDSACATVVRHGFDVRYFKLNVQVRYDVQNGADRKVVTYPDDPDFGSQQANLSEHWNSKNKWFGNAEIVRKMRGRKREGRFHPAWCDNRSFDIRGLTNDRIVWRGYGFGRIRPMLLRVHRKEIARDNRKHVPFLLSLLSDEDRFAAAHIALSCILGIDEFCIKEPIGNSFNIHLNGLHMIVKRDENDVLRATYPHAERQQAWLRYRWETFLEFDTQQNSQN